MNITHMECGHTIMPICSISGIFTDILRQMQRNVHGAAGVLAGLHINSRVPNFHYKPTNSRILRKNDPFPNAKHDKWYVFCVLKTAGRINWKTAERKLRTHPGDHLLTRWHAFFFLPSIGCFNGTTLQGWCGYFETSFLGTILLNDMFLVSQKRSCSKNRLRILISSFKWKTWPRVLYQGLDIPHFFRFLKRPVGFRDTQMVASHKLATCPTGKRICNTWIKPNVTV